MSTHSISTSILSLINLSLLAFQGDSNCEAPSLEKHRSYQGKRYSLPDFGDNFREKILCNSGTRTTDLQFSVLAP